MQWLTRTPNFNFVKWRRAAMIGSGLASLLAIVVIVYPGLNYGVDFTGGVIVEVEYDGPAELDAIRARLAEADLGSPQVQNLGASSRVQIRLPPDDTGTVTAVQERVLEVLRAHDAGVRFREAASVGSQVGDDLFENAGLALLFALMLVFVYVMLRFRWKLAVGAIVATLHDLLVTTGIFAVAGWQFDLTVLGSILAVLGYSLNDTIVVYDRVRDNFRLMRRGTAETIVNAAVNQTLARTLVTGVTSLLVLFALMFLGGEALWGFSVALIIGIVVGTYSSIYIASSMALALEISPSDFHVTKQEKVDELP
jgi:preprotein translocase subunit SecF